MEALWDDLTKNEAVFESPAWHEEELKDRDKACASGNTSISDWNDAKKRIRKNVACEVKLLDAAEKDIEEGYRFYEKQAPGPWIILS